MRRVLFRVRGRAIHSYPAMLYLGLVAGTMVAVRVAAADGLPVLRVYATILVLLLPALAGARLLYVVANWREFRGRAQRIVRASEGGASLYGGLVSVAVSVPLLRVVGIAFWEFWDVATFTVLIGMALTKIGCLLNGCCAGRMTTGLLGLATSDHRGIRERRIPVQLLESATAVVLLAAATIVWPRRPFAGAIFLGMLLAYGGVRAWLECLRDIPAVDRLGTVRVNLVISTGLAGLAVSGLAALALR